MAKKRTELPSAELPAPNSELMHTWKIWIQHLDPEGQDVGEVAETMLTRPGLLDLAAVERFVAKRWTHTRFVRAERLNRWDVRLTREQAFDADGGIARGELPDQIARYLPAARRLVWAERESRTSNGRVIQVWRVTAELELVVRLAGDFPDAAAAGAQAVRQHVGWMYAGATLVAEETR